MFFNRELSLILCTFAVVAAIIALQPGSGVKVEPPNHEKTAADSQDPSAGPSQDAEGPLTPVFEFMGPGHSARDRRIRFLIMTVPDPVDSRFDYLFDQVMEAVQRALERAEYVVDRSWVPWQSRGNGQASGRSGRHVYREQPGLILFRREAAGDGNQQAELLVLLLVGETPTAGIHKAAFAKAITLLSPLGIAGGEPLRIIAPFFSGSHTSVTQSLQQVRRLQPTRPIQVICGSANAFDHTVFIQGWKRTSDCFQTTIHPESLVRRWLYKFLVNPTDPGARTGLAQPVLILQESNTGFGSSTGQEDITPGVNLFTVPFPMHISQLAASYTQEQLARLKDQGIKMPVIYPTLPLGDDGAREPLPAQSPATTMVIHNIILNNIISTIAQRKVRYIGLIASDVRDKIFLAESIRGRYPDIQLFTTGGDLLLADPNHNYALRGMLVGSSYPLNPNVQRWSEHRDTHTIGGTRMLFSDESSQGYFNAALIHLADMEPNAQLKEKKLANLKDYGWSELGKTTSRPGIWISAVGLNGQVMPLYHAHAKCIQTDIDNIGQANAVSAEKVKQLKQIGEQLKNMYTAAVPVAVEPPLLPVRALPNLLLGLFVVLALAAAYSLKRAYWDWWSESSWDSDNAGMLMAACKQHIDLVLLASTVVIALVGAARLLYVCIRRGPWRSGLADLLNPEYALLWLSLITIGCALLLIEAVVLWSFLKRNLNGNPCQRKGWWEATNSMINESPPTQGLPESLPFRTGLWLFIADASAVFGCTLLVTGGFYCIFRSPESVQVLLYFQRAVSLFSGLSPLVPLLFLCTAVHVWGAFLVKKLYLANRYNIPCPFPSDAGKEFADLQRLDGQLRDELMPPSTFRMHPLLCLLILLLLLASYGALSSESIAPIDGSWFGWLTRLGFFVGAFLLVFTLCQVYLAWKKLQRMLRVIALLPMSQAFERLPDKVVAIFGHYFYNLRPRSSHLEIAGHQYEIMRGLLAAFQAGLAECAKDPTRSARMAAAERIEWAAAAKSVETMFANQALPAFFEPFRTELNSAEERDFEVPNRGSAQILHENVGKCLAVLVHFWPGHSMQEAFGRSFQEQPLGGKADNPAPAGIAQGLPSPGPADVIRDWVHAAEDLAAIEIVRYLSQFYIQLRNLLASLTVGSLLLLLAALSYRFYPQQLLLTFLTVLTGAVAVFILGFLVQVNRDELTSRITRSTPNRFTPDLSFLNAAGAYILPILGGLVVQFPFIANGIRSALEPLFHVIR